MSCPRAVSYTHLDVYKRQASAFNLLMSSLALVVILALGLGSVSYTHLDVYKRQGSAEPTQQATQAVPADPTRNYPAFGALLLFVLGCWAWARR